MKDINLKTTVYLIATLLPSITIGLSLNESSEGESKSRSVSSIPSVLDSDPNRGGV